MDNTIQITVTKERQKYLTDPAIEIFLDDNKVGEVKNGQTEIISAAAGSHRIEFKCSVRSAFIDANFTQNANITLKFNRGSGEIETTLQGAVAETVVLDWADEDKEKGKTYPDSRKTSPVVAAILSVVITGLGQMLNGQLLKGIIILVVSMIVGAATGALLAPVCWIIAAVDAYMCAYELKKGKPIGKLQFFPH